MNDYERWAEFGLVPYREGDLLAIDPSIISPGVALFRDRVLVAADRLVVKATGNLAYRSLTCADRIAQWVNARSDGPDAIAYEWPQIYARDTPSTANSIVTMASVALAVTAACALGARARCKVPLDIGCYRPAEIWGQLPKAKSGSALRSPRAKRILSRLSANEQALVPDQHDAIDAVGIGLHHLGRLGLRKVLVAK